MWAESRLSRECKKKKKWCTVPRNIPSSFEPQLLCSFSGQSILFGIRNRGRGLPWRRLINRTSSSETRSSRPLWNGISWLLQKTLLLSACIAPLRPGATCAWSWNMSKVSHSDTENMTPVPRNHWLLCAADAFCTCAIQWLYPRRNQGQAIRWLSSQSLSSHNCL